MRDMVKMVVVLTIISAASGGLLAYVREGTKDDIESNKLKFVQGPAVKSIFAEASADPVDNRITVQEGTFERTVFVGIYNGKPEAVAFETFASGYGGEIGVMVGVKLEDRTLAGVSITTHQETPGLGERAKSDPSFTRQFEGKKLSRDLKVRPDGGQIDALAGATITSRAVCNAVEQAAEVYERLEPKLKQQLDSM